MHQTQDASSKEYYIISVQHSQYLHDTRVSFPRAIAVINSDVQAPKFTVTNGSGENTYTIEVNGRVVREGSGGLIYSFEDGNTEEWNITFIEAERAYIIESKGIAGGVWTAPLGGDLLQIRLEPLALTDHRQLFRFDSL